MTVIALFRLNLANGSNELPNIFKLADELFREAVNFLSKDCYDCHSVCILMLSERRAFTIILKVKSILIFATVANLLLSQQI